jgi:hypothetical protein
VAVAVGVNMSINMCLDMTRTDDYYIVGAVGHSHEAIM